MCMHDSFEMAMTQLASRFERLVVEKVAEDAAFQVLTMPKVKRLGGLHNGYGCGSI